jgi:hypothetical protein
MAGNERATCQVAVLTKTVPDAFFFRHPFFAEHLWDSRTLVECHLLLRATTPLVHLQ